jgi:putative ABC transport system ATP-binding protein
VRPVTTYPRGEGAIASARGLVKVYGSGETAVRALDGVDVDFASGELTAIMGPSGSGKSTLMHCMAGLDTVTEGSVVVAGEDVSRMSQRGLTKLRRDRLGFVFQAFNLIPTLTAAENITLPLDIARRPVDRAWFDQVVDSIGLRDRLRHRPSELSGGQQQRVACARALVSRPAVVFADEPTGNLDSRSSGEVLGFLRDSVDQLGQAVVMVTHDPSAASFAHRVLFLADGQLVGQIMDPTAETVLDALRELGVGRRDRSELVGAAAGGFTAGGLR